MTLRVAFHDKVLAIPKPSTDFSISSDFSCFDESSSTYIITAIELNGLICDLDRLFSKNTLSLKKKNTLYMDMDFFKVKMDE